MPETPREVLDRLLKSARALQLVGDVEPDTADEAEQDAAPPTEGSAPAE